MKIERIPSWLIRRAGRAGADQAEVYLLRRDGLSLSWRDGELESIQRATSAGVGLRLIVGRRLAFVSSSDLSEASLSRLVDRGVALARRAEPDESQRLPEPTDQVPDRKIFDPQVSEVPLEKKLDWLRRAEAAARRADRRVRHTDGAWWYDELHEITLHSSRGGPISHTGSLFGTGISVVAEAAGERETGSAGCWRRFHADLRPADELGREAAETAGQLLGGGPIESGELPVVLDRRGPAPGLLRWGIGQAILGEEVRQQRSFLAGKLAQKVAGAQLTVVDDGRKPQGLASRPFDAEGVRTDRTVLIDGGQLKQLIYDSATARRAETESTGNAVRDGIDGPPGPGFTNLYVEPGKLPLDQLIAQIPHGFYCRRTQGFGIDAAAGHYSMAAQGRLIRDGRLAEPVRGVTLVGRLADMLAGIDAVANDLTFDGYDWGSSISCPSLRIAGMTIAGS